MADGFPADMTQEEIEEKLLWEFRQTGGAGGVISPETAQLLVKMLDDAGKGQPPDPEKEKERAEARQQAKTEEQRKAREAEKAEAEKLREQR